MKKKNTVFKVEVKNELMAFLMEKLAGKSRYKHQVTSYKEKSFCK